MSRLRPKIPAAVVSWTVASACGSRLTTPEAPAPTPSAAPAPTPLPTPAEVYGCGLPRGEGRGWHCPRLNPSFDGEVDAAIQRVIDQHPDYFDLRRARGGSFYVRAQGPYTFEVVENQRAMGLCALDDGKEIAVKNDKLLRSISGALFRQLHRPRPGQLPRHVHPGLGRDSTRGSDS